MWVPILIKLIYHGTSTSDLEKEYVQYLPKVNKSTHGMYINSLTKKMLISNEQSSDIVRENFNQEEIEKWVVNKIQDIYKSEYNSAIKRAKKWLDEWSKYYNENYSKNTIHIPTSLEKDNFYKVFSKNEIQWSKFEIAKKDNLKKVTLKSENLTSNGMTKEIGDIGEKLFYDQLIKRYGFDAVDWISRDIDPFSPYDFRVTVNGAKKYFEVKSTTRNSITFFLSRNEYEFWKINKKNYHLITIKNIYMKNTSSYPIIEEIENPLFLIDLEYYGTKNGMIYITPNKFKGWI